MIISVGNIDRAISKLCSELAGLNTVVEQAESGQPISVSSTAGLGADIIFDQIMLVSIKEIIKQKESQLQKVQSARDAAQNKIDEMIEGNVPYEPIDKAYIHDALIK